jgi:hypothetical protein
MTFLGETQRYAFPLLLSSMMAAAAVTKCTTLNFSQTISHFCKLFSQASFGPCVETVVRNWGIVASWVREIGPEIFTHFGPLLAV